MTQSIERRSLTAEQKAEYNLALHKFIIRTCKRNNLTAKDMPVIIAPELKFDDVTNEWLPIENTGARPTKQDGLLYIRLVQPYLGETAQGLDIVKFHSTNVLVNDADWKALCENNDYYIGSIMYGKRLVAQETTEPTYTIAGKLSNGWQPKLSGVDGVPLMSNGKAIYRRIALVNTVDKETGEVLVAKSTLVAHDNTDAVKSSALKRLADNARKALENNINSAKITEPTTEGTEETPAETPVAEGTEPTTTATTEK